MKTFWLKKRGFLLVIWLKLLALCDPNLCFLAYKHRNEVTLWGVDYLENVNVWYWNFNLKNKLNQIVKKNSKSLIVLTWWNLNLNPIKWNKDKHVFVLICYFWQDPFVLYWIEALLPWSNSNYICVCYQMSLNIA